MSLSLSSSHLSSSSFPPIPPPHHHLPPPLTHILSSTTSNMEKVDELLDALAEKGHRESKLKAALIQVRKQLETNFETK